MILEVFLETGAIEIICPVKEANLLAERTISESMILSMVLAILATLLSTMSMVPRSLSHVIPSQSSRWQGTHTDLSPLHRIRNNTAHLRILFNTPSFVKKKKSNANTLMPPIFLKRLQNFGEHVRGRTMIRKVIKTVNTWNFTLLELESFQEKNKVCLMALKNFNVMVPTFQIEGKHICNESSYLTSILPKNLLTYLK